jgi:putative PIN family toxin of toxin-antitoxin system
MRFGGSVLENELPVRVVIDTNVWISGLLWKGLPWHVLRLAEENRIEIVVTLPMLEELETVLHYSRLQPRCLELGLEITDLIAYTTTTSPR